MRMYIENIKYFTVRETKMHALKTHKLNVNVVKEEGEKRLKKIYKDHSHDHTQKRENLRSTDS